MKKILIVNDGFPPHSWGGANTVAYLHAQGLRREGFDVRVYTTTSHAQAAGDSVYESIPVRTIYTVYHPRWWAYRSLYNPEVLKLFRYMLDEFRPDIVHFHNIHHRVSYHAIVLAKRSGAKVFLTTHDVMSFAYQKLHHYIDYTDTTIPATCDYHVPWWVNLRDARLRYNPFRNVCIRWYLRRLDHVFAVSDVLRQALADNGISGNVSVVHNGIDADTFNQSADARALRQQLGLDDVRVLLFVGRFTPDKGRDVTVRALARVIQDVPNTILLVIGFDPTLQPEPALERLIDELGVRDHIMYVGSAPYVEIGRYYALANCVLVPSIIFDSFPTVNLEAMAAGKPVVATCFGGSREAVVDGETGYIVNPLNISTMAEKVSTILSDAHTAYNMGEAGLKRVRTDLTLAKQLSEYTTWY